MISQQASTATTSRATVHVWGRWEGVLHSATPYDDSVNDVALMVQLVAPSGAHHTIPAFWDGGQTWRVRFMPNEVGAWTYTTHCTPADSGLHDQQGGFSCTPYEGDNPLYRHGAIGLSRSRHNLAHADGTPFFYLADTVWLGPMLSTPAEWELYLTNRAAKKFTAAQFLATPFRSLAQNAEGRAAYAGTEHITIDPVFFQRLDERIDAMNAHGILAVPLVIHAGKDTPLNPGKGLPQDQVIVLARYMVARFGGYHVLWDLIAEANFHGEDADYWRAVGRAIFPRPPYPLVTLHPYGMDWALEEFNEEPWMTVMGYQSAHGDNEAYLRWITEGPASRDWTRQPVRPYMNLEPPYEGHIARHSGKRFDDVDVRRACYWSVLVSPPAGVCYGAHGIWSWSDGKEPPMAHKDTGTPLPWQDALDMPASFQMTHLVDLMESLPWWTLRPHQSLIAQQPGQDDARRMLVAVRSEDGTLGLIYSPREESLTLNPRDLSAPLRATWFNPRSAERHSGGAVPSEQEWTVATPGPGDWVLILESATTG